MRPPPHVLFPAGEEGGKSRSIQEAAKHSTSNTTGIINVEIERRVCKDCGKEGFSFRCECGGFTGKKRVCPKCNIPAPDKCPKCGKETTAVAKMQIDVKKLYHQALERLGEREPESLKGVLGLSSRDKTPEPLEKGILRAKHGVNIFKDGTVRYDLTDLPLTHFRSDEIGTSPEILCSLGYTEDMHGQPLTAADQVCELRVQDIILATDAGDYLLKVARFVDELLVKFYGLAAILQCKDFGGPDRHSHGRSRSAHLSGRALPPHRLQPGLSRLWPSLLSCRQAPQLRRR